MFHNDKSLSQNHFCQTLSFWAIFALICHLCLFGGRDGGGWGGGGVFRASTNLPQSRVFKVLEASEQGDMRTVDARGSTRRRAASDSSAVDFSFSITICLFIMQISGGGVEKGFLETGVSVGSF